VRQVDADDGVAVARHGVQLRPGEGAAGAGLVDDDHFLLVLRLERLRLQPRRDVGLAACRERDDVLHRLVRVRERDGGERQRRRADERTDGSTDLHCQLLPGCGALTAARRGNDSAAAA